MHKTILTTVLVTLGTLLFATTAWGDNALIRRGYELRRIDLEQDYKARREANKYAYHRERDALHAARRRANRIDCRDTRALRVRAINRDLTALSRDYHAKNRAITAWHHNERDALRTSYEVALRTARRPAIRSVGINGLGYNVVDNVVDTVVEREVVVERPIVGRHIIERPVVDRPLIEVPAPIIRPHGHPANCDCHVCEPPVNTLPNTNGFDFGSDYGINYGGRNVGNGRDFVPTGHGRNANTVDWASLIFSLIR